MTGDKMTGGGDACAQQTQAKHRSSRNVARRRMASPYTGAAGARWW